MVGGAVPGRGRGHRRRVTRRWRRCRWPASSTAWSSSAVTASVLRPAKLWNDTESAPEAAAHGVSAGCRRLGGPDRIGPGGRLHRHQAGLVGPTRAGRSPAAVRSVLLPHDYLTYRLTGRRVTDRGDASGTGYFDPVGRRLAGRPAGRQWSGRPTGSIGCRPCSARPRRPGRSGADGLGRSRHRRASKSWVRGPVTTWRRRSGVGLAPGQACVSIGTSGTVYARSDRPVADPTGHRGRVRRCRRWLPAAGLHPQRHPGDRRGGRACSGSPRWAWTTWPSPLPPGRPGLTLLPYFDGERTPDRPTATGTLAGLRSGVPPRGSGPRRPFEGVVCGLLDALDVLGRAGGGATTAPLLAGRGRRPVAGLSAGCWPTCRAGPVLVPDIGEAVATGACVQAAAALLGRPLDAVQAAWGLGGGELVEPDPPVDAVAVRQAYAAVRG